MIATPYPIQSVAGVNLIFTARQTVLHQRFGIT